MPLLVTDVVNDALSLFGCDSINGVPVNLKNRILADLNRVRQTMFMAEDADFHINTPTGTILNAPLVLTGLALTFGAKTITGAGLLPWMDRCTCFLGDDGVQNVILQTGASTYALETPYAGTTSESAGGKVYNDAVSRPATSLSIDRPVILEGCWELLPTTNRAEMRDLFRPWGGGSDYGQITNFNQGTYPVLGAQRISAPPRQYQVDSRTDYLGNMGIYIRLNPMPDQQYVLKWIERVLPTPIASLSDTTTILCPHRFEESVFLPLMRDALKSYPTFTGDKALIAAEAVTARKVLSQTGKPQENVDLIVRTQGHW